MRWGFGECRPSSSKAFYTSQACPSIGRFVRDRAGRMYQGGRGLSSTLIEALAMILHNPVK